jgi:photosystem II stability/assembly factor-like uncharacterized protein
MMRNSNIQTAALSFLLIIGMTLASGCMILPQAAAETPSATFVVAEVPSATPVPTSTPIPTEVQPPPTPAAASSAVKLVQLKMFTMQDGWAVGERGQILRSTNGVSSWTAVTPPSFPKTSEHPFRITAFFLDMDHAWVSADLILQNLVIFYTRDGGKTWATGEIPVDARLGGVPQPVELFFTDPVNGWMVGQDFPGMFHVYPFIYRTTTGGQYWTLIHDPLPNSNGIADSERLAGSYSLPEGGDFLVFLNLKRGIAGTGSLFTTQDGGDNWQPLTLRLPDGLPVLKNAFTYIGKPSFSNPVDGFVPVRIYEFNQVYCPPCDMFNGLPQVNLLYFTHDGGLKWTPKPAPAKIGVSDFLNGQDGWFLGKSDATGNSAARMYVTHDGGDSWNLLAGDPGLPLGSRMEFISGQIGYAWNQYIGETQNPYKNFDTRTENTAYIFITRDGGITWNPVEAKITK